MFATATATVIVTATAAATATATAAVTRLLPNRSHRYPSSCHRFYGSIRDHPPDIRDFYVPGWKADLVYLAENPLWGCSAAVAPGPYEAPPSRGSFI